MSQKTVRKRDGNIVSFDANKIITAISKANNTTHEIGYKEIETIANQINKLTNNTSCVDIEVIQDLVERKLQEFEFYETAKAYILYREKRHQQREAASNLMQSYNELLFTDSGDMDLKRDNANINGDAPMGIMLKLGAEGAKAWATNYALPEKFVKPHREHIYHIHDMDFSFITLNCLQQDLGKTLRGGFDTGHGFLREPNSVRAAASLACIAIQSSQNDMFGGQAINALDFALAPYVAKSFKKALWNKYKEWLYYNDVKVTEVDKTNFNKIDFSLLHYTEDRDLHILTDDNITITAGDYLDYFLDIGITAGNKIYDVACQDVEEETKQAMEAMIHNFNSLHSRAGRGLCAG